MPDNQATGDEHPKYTRLYPGVGSNRHAVISGMKRKHSFEYPDRQDDSTEDGQEE